MALPARIDPSHPTGLVQISTTRAPLHGARAGADRVEIQSLRAPAKPGELRLAEIRPFAFRGKHYVFVVPVTGIFEISELAAEIIGLFLTGAASDGEPVYTAASIESRSLVAQQVVNALSRSPYHPFHRARSFRAAEFWESC